MCAGLWLNPAMDPTRLARGINGLGQVAIFLCLHRMLILRLRPRGCNAAAHAAANLAVFPPLFFFSALYYTDVVSVLSVLLTCNAFDAQRPVLVVLGGLVSLTLRQTNIFWVAVYLGGREALRSLKRVNAAGGSPADASFLGIAGSGWHHGSLYDPLVREACFQGRSSLEALRPGKVADELPRLFQEHCFTWYHGRGPAQISACAASPIHLPLGSLWLVCLVESRRGSRYVRIRPQRSMSQIFAYSLVRRQGESYCIYTPHANALHLAIHSLLLLPNATAILNTSHTLFGPSHSSQAFP